MSLSKSAVRWTSWESLGVNPVVGSLLAGVSVGGVIWVGLELKRKWQGQQSPQLNWISEKSNQLFNRVRQVWTSYKCPIVIGLGVIGMGFYCYQTHHSTKKPEFPKLLGPTTTRVFRTVVQN